MNEKAASESAVPGRRPASLLSLVFLGLSGQQIGPGIALAGGYLLVYSGYASWLSMLIAMAAAMAMSIAVSVFAQKHVVGGSLVSYVGIALGRRPQRLVAAFYLLGFLSACAGVVASVVIFTSSLLAEAGFDQATSPWFMSLSSVVIALLAGLVAYRGLDVSIVVTSILTVISIPLIIVVVIGTAVNNGVDLPAQLLLQDSTVAHIAEGVIIAMAYFVGFDALAALATESKDPKRTVPRLLNIVLTITGLSFIITMLLTVPALMTRTDELLEGAAPSALLADLAGMSYLQTPIDILMVGATFATLVAFMNYGSRVFATAAEHGLLPSKLIMRHPRFGSPAIAVMVMTAFAGLLPVSLQLLAATPPLEASVYMFTLFAYFWFVPYVALGIAAITEMAKTKRVSVLRVTVIVFGSLVFAGLFVYSFFSGTGGVLGALPYITLLSAGAVWSVFELRSRRVPVGAGEL